ncbi:lipopolysaccharide biosynthesis protein [Novosphingobium panipatense]|nr:lipopolysaccharide biosynthesis protein [Novosphingobium panipatense]
MGANPSALDAGRAPGNHASIRRKSAQGIAINMTAQAFRFGLQFVVSIVMARLLGPSEFGLLAMAAPLIAFVALFADLGLSQATVQRPEISQAQLSLIFWTSALVSVTSGVIVMLGAPLASIFYGEPRVQSVLVALGAILMLTGFYNQHVALLNRRLAFGSLVAVDLGSYTLSSIAGISAALLGFSYWSLVISQATLTISALVLAWSLARWVPSRPGKAPEAREILGFGGNVTGFNIFNYFARNLDNVLIGRTLGEVQLGIYDRAYKLLLLPLSQITGPIAKVATPLLSRLDQDREKYRRSYLMLLETVILLTYPSILVTGVASQLVIYTVLGAKWYAVAPIFQVLAIGALFAPVSNSTGWLFTTQNRTREMRNYGLLSSLAFVASFVVGLPWGIQGVANAYIATGCVQGPLLWYAATRRGPITFNALLRALIPYALGAIVTSGTVWLSARYLAASWTNVVLLLAIGHLVFWVTVAATPRGRATLNTLLDEGRRLMRRS